MRSALSATESLQCLEASRKFPQRIGQRCENHIVGFGDQGDSEDSSQASKGLAALFANPVPIRTFKNFKS